MKKFILFLVMLTWAAVFMTMCDTPIAEGKEATTQTVQLPHYPNPVPVPDIKPETITAMTQALQQVVQQTAKPTAVLDQFVAKALQYVEKTEVFMSDQVPLYVQELLTFTFYKDMMWLVIALLSIIPLSMLLKSSLNGFKNAGPKDCLDPYMIGTTFAACMLVLCVVIALSNVFEMVKISTAPRVFVIDELTSKLKSD